ncbi:hypothetical protein [uncultured Weissella sp.]|uniref:hypothetical protein n=1 Tax=uncultured Weissella sp. TaxID=253243 RepID=UPI0027DD56DE|nr:hypothetical protein [uncultured Weissella sp.]
MHLSIQTVYIVVVGANMLFLILCGLGIYRGARDHDRYLVIVYLLLTLGILIAVKLTLQATGLLN